MAEHIVIRNHDINDVDLIEVDADGAFTQSHIGHPFRRVGTDGLLIGIGPGDTVWVAQSGYGVVGDCVVADVPPVTKIESLYDIEALRKDGRYKGLAGEYWDQERTKVMAARAKGKSLYWSAIHTRLGRRFPVTEHFCLELPKGAQNSWITLTSASSPIILGQRGRPIMTGGADVLVQRKCDSVIVVV